VHLQHAKGLSCLNDGIDRVDRCSGFGLYLRCVEMYSFDFPVFHIGTHVKARYSCMIARSESEPCVVTSGDFN